MTSFVHKQANAQVAMATNPVEILAQARREGEASMRKTNALQHLMKLATEVAEVVKDVTDEQGLDTENEEHLGEAPNPHQLLTDRKLAVKERIKLQERDILQPPPMPQQQDGPILKVDGDRVMGRKLPVTPKSHWVTAKDLALSQTEQASIEQQRRVARKLKSLAKTPHPMLLARIQQLVSSFAEIRKDVASVKQELQAALLATKRSGRTFKRGQSMAATRALKTGPSMTPSKLLQSGLMLQLEGAENSPAGHCKGLSLTGRPREEERLRALENKERTLSEELAVTLQFLSERLRMLPLPLLMQLVPTLTLQQCEQHSLIYNRDEEATTLYVVLSGTFESIFLSPGEVHRPLVPKKLLAIYRRGACFGESELLHGTSRSTTVVCNSIGLIACISQRDYLEVLGKYLIKQEGLTKSFLRLRVEPLRSLPDSSLESFVRFLEPRKLAEGFEIDVMQERPATLYIILEGHVQFQALDHRAAPSLEEAQAQVRDPLAPTMAETGVLANVTVMEGGHAQGTLGQAGRLKELVRKMTPTKVLGDGNVGAVFGGGKALLGEGDYQDCIKVVAQTPLHVIAVPVEQLLLSDPGGVVAALRQYIALQTAVGHKNSELCLQVARAAKAAEEQIKKEKLRKAARINAQKVSGSQKTKRGDVVEACLKHVTEVRRNFEAEIDRAQIDEYGTPTEKFWAGSEAATENHARANHVLERVFPHKLQPLCNRLDVLQERAEQRAIKTAHLAERQVLLRQNSAILDDFMARLKRPISAAEAQTLLKANGGLDIPEDNALNLRPMTAAPQLPPRAPYSEIGDCMSMASFMERPRTSPAAPGKKPGELSAACRMWENSQGRRVPAVRQMLTFGEIRRHKIEKAMLSGSGERPTTAANIKSRRCSMCVQGMSCQG